MKLLSTTTMKNNNRRVSPRFSSIIVILLFSVLTAHTTSAFPDFSWLTRRNQQVDERQDSVTNIGLRFMSGLSEGLGQTFRGIFGTSLATERPIVRIPKTTDKFGDFSSNNNRVNPQAQFNPVPSNPVQSSNINTLHTNSIQTNGFNSVSSNPVKNNNFNPVSSNSVHSNSFGTGISNPAQNNNFNPVPSNPVQSNSFSTTPSQLSTAFDPVPKNHVTSGTLNGVTLNSNPFGMSSSDHTNSGSNVFQNHISQTNTQNGATVNSHNGLFSSTSNNNKIGGGQVNPNIASFITSQGNNLHQASLPTNNDITTSSIENFNGKAFVNNAGVSANSNGLNQISIKDNPHQNGETTEDILSKLLVSSVLSGSNTNKFPKESIIHLNTGKATHPSENFPISPFPKEDMKHKLHFGGWVGLPEDSNSNQQFNQFSSSLNTNQIPSGGKNIISTNNHQKLIFVPSVNLELPLRDSLHDGDGTISIGKSLNSMNDNEGHINDINTYNDISTSSSDTSQFLSDLSVFDKFKYLNAPKDKSNFSNHRQLISNNNGFEKSFISNSHSTGNKQVGNMFTDNRNSDDNSGTLSFTQVIDNADVNQVMEAQKMITAIPALNISQFIDQINNGTHIFDTELTLKSLLSFRKKPYKVDDQQFYDNNGFYYNPQSESTMNINSFVTPPSIDAHKSFLSKQGIRFPSRSDSSIDYDITSYEQQVNDSEDYSGEPFQYHKEPIWNRKSTKKNLNALSHQHPSTPLTTLPPAVMESSTVKPSTESVRWTNFRNSINQNKMKELTTQSPTSEITTQGRGKSLSNISSDMNTFRITPKPNYRLKHFIPTIPPVEHDTVLPIRNQQEVPFNWRQAPTTEITSVPVIESFANPINYLKHGTTTTNIPFLFREKIVTMPHTASTSREQYNTNSFEVKSNHSQVNNRHTSRNTAFDYFDMVDQGLGNVGKSQTVLNENRNMNTIEEQLKQFDEGFQFLNKGSASHPTSIAITSQMREDPNTKNRKYYRNNKSNIRTASDHKNELPIENRQRNFRRENINLNKFENLSNEERVAIEDYLYTQLLPAEHKSLPNHSETSTFNEKATNSIRRPKQKNGYLQSNDRLKQSLYLPESSKSTSPNKSNLNRIRGRNQDYYRKPRNSPQTSRPTSTYRDSYTSQTTNSPEITTRANYFGSYRWRASSTTTPLPEKEEIEDEQPAEKSRKSVFDEWVQKSRDRIATISSTTITEIPEPSEEKNEYIDSNISYNGRNQETSSFNYPSWREIKSRSTNKAFHQSPRGLQVAETRTNVVAVSLPEENQRHTRPKRKFARNTPENRRRLARWRRKNKKNNEQKHHNTAEVSVDSTMTEENNDKVMNWGDVVDQNKSMSTEDKEMNVKKLGSWKSRRRVTVRSRQYTTSDIPKL